MEQSFASPPCFGKWCDQLRKDRGNSRSELADQLGNSMEASTTFSETALAEMPGGTRQAQTTWFRFTKKHWTVRKKIRQRTAGMSKRPSGSVGLEGEGLEAKLRWKTGRRRWKWKVQNEMRDKMKLPKSKLNTGMLTPLHFECVELTLVGSVSGSVWR